MNMLILISLFPYKRGLKVKEVGIGGGYWSLLELVTVFGQCPVGDED